MKHNDNKHINFFIDMRDELEREIITLKNILAKKNERLNYITKVVKETCPHEWENDNIDIYPDRKEGVEIKYCKYCLITNCTC
jgi:hypothetical protein